MRPFKAALALVAIATAVGIAILWPDDPKQVLSEGLTMSTERAEVTAVTHSACPPPQTGTCVDAAAELETGADEGAAVQLALGGSALAPDLEPGDTIRLSRQAPPPGADPDPLQGGPTYTFTDFERRRPMLLLALIFAVLVIALGRARGALSLLGLAASLAVVALFIVPAILDGSSPLAVAVVGSMAVMLLTISLAHGLGPKSLAAMLGTTLSLILVASLGLAFVEFTNLTGLASEESVLLQLGGAEVSFEGLVLAGMVIGALGVLDDVTVSQSSTVIALRQANPALGFRQLYRGAIEVGRDHVSATVNTLVLAYVGTSLPVLLILGSGQLGLVDAVNLELVAQEIVGTLVGSIGLVAAVPITTVLAALLARGVAPDQLAVEPAHAH